MGLLMVAAMTVVGVLIGNEADESSECGDETDDDSWRTLLISEK